MIEELEINITNHLDNIENIKINYNQKTLIYKNKKYILNEEILNNLIETIYLIKNNNKSEIIDNTIIEIKQNQKIKIINQNDYQELLYLLKEITNE